MTHYTKETIMRIFNQTFPENPPKESDMFVGKKELSMAGFMIFQQPMGEKYLQCMEISLSKEEYLRAPFIRQFLDARDNLIDSYFIYNRIQNRERYWGMAKDAVIMYLFGNIADAEIFSNVVVLKDILLEDYRKFVEENKGDLK